MGAMQVETELQFSLVCRDYIEMEIQSSEFPEGHLHSTKDGEVQASASRG